MIQEEEIIDEKSTEENNQEPNAAAEEQPNAADEQKELSPEERIAQLEQQLADQKDSYLRLMAEFDNYRKNMLKRMQDSMKYGGEEAFKSLLPVIDNLERALDSIEKSDDLASAKEGIEIIYKQFTDYLTKNKVSAIAPKQGDTFDESIHDAMTMFPAPDPSLKGKVIDCPTKGYKLDDKVIRFAKVVVGQ